MISSFHGAERHPMEEFCTHFREYTMIIRGVIFRTDHHMRNPYEVEILDRKDYV